MRSSWGWLTLLSLAALPAACTTGTPPGEGEGAPSAGAAPGATLRAVRQRGALKCGISQAAGFATPDAAGRWQGFDVEFCRALAVAIFGDAERTEYVPFTMQQRFAGLQSGEVDILINGTSITSSRALGRGFHFGPVYLYDGQGFMVARDRGLAQASQLDGATVCVRQGTTSELNLADFARRHAISLRPVVMDDLRAAVSAFAGGRCDAISQDIAGLATTRSMLPDPSRFVILPDRISKEPIAPVVRFGDDQWLALVNWVFWTPVQAEEFGLARATVQDSTRSTDPALRRFLGLEPGITDAFGLDPQWTLRVVAAVGHYGEIFDRHLGEATPLGMPRGLNRQWTAGGLLYAPPFR